MEDAGVVRLRRNVSPKKCLRRLTEDIYCDLLSWLWKSWRCDHELCCRYLRRGSEEDKPPKHAFFGNVGRLHKQIHEERGGLGAFHQEVTAQTSLMLTNIVHK